LVFSPFQHRQTCAKAEKYKTFSQAEKHVPSNNSWKGNNFTYIGRCRYMHQSFLNGEMSMAMFDCRRVMLALFEDLFECFGKDFWWMHGMSQIGTGCFPQFLGAWGVFDRCH
jgi:hypothetical protein